MQKKRVPIVPQGALGVTADRLMKPVMSYLQANYTELSQRTHFWNNQKFHDKELDWLDVNEMLIVTGDPNAVTAWKWGLVPIFHMPRFGGWTQYVVLSPGLHSSSWHVGWMPEGIPGVSKVVLTTSVRVLRGAGDCQFFATDYQGYQIKLKQIGEGTIGDQQWGHLPLL